MGILLGVLTFVLILVSLFLIMVVLAQKSKDGGMGAAFGGGAAEAAFGAETSNVLSKSTIYSSIVFFVLAFLLYLGRIYERGHASAASGSALPTIAAPAAPAPTPATTPATAKPATTAPVTATPAPATSSTAPAASTSTAPAPKKP